MRKLFILLLLAITSILSYAKPTRAVSTAQFTTEILLAIGAENQMVGTAFLDNPILPELKEKYEKIPVLSTKYPTKEKFYSVNPDFVTGWKSVVDPKNLGPESELKENGIQVYFMKSLNSNNIDDVFNDILEFGKIFELQENANALVTQMKNQLNSIKEKLPKEKIKVFAYDSGENTPFVVGGGGIGNTIISLAGGDNIFKNTNGSFVNGNWEKILIEDPEMIVIVDYGDNSYENKIKFLKEESPIKECQAVKNNKFVVVGLGDISVGVRNVNTIKKLAKAFHNVEI